jgi:cytochrome P450
MAAAAPPLPASFQNPFANPQLLADPYPVYAMLRQASPVFRVPIPGHDGPGLWVLTRHADVHAVLRDGRFSVDRRNAALVRAFRERLPVQLIEGPGALRSMLFMDPPDHTRVRGLVSKAFTPRRAAALAPRIEVLVDGLLDDLAARSGGEIDLIRDLAEPLPAVVIAELLGVPPEDHRVFRGWSSALVNAVGRGPAGAPEEVQARVEPITAYLGEVIAERRRAPGDDLISAMIQAQEERDALSDAELLATSFLLLLAGHETTTNLIGNGTLALLRHPGELARLCAEPGLLENAIEELLRYDSPVQATARIPLEDVVIGGLSVPKESLVMTVLGAANRDPAVFEAPDRLDVGRGEARQHLSFGFGTHFCLGAGLARLEARIAFEKLLARFPRLAPAGSEPPPRRPNFFLRGLASLPVRVD